MFDVDTLVSDCLAGIDDSDPQRAVRETLLRTLDNPQPVADVLGGTSGGITVLYNSPELTVLNVIYDAEDRAPVRLRADPGHVPCRERRVGEAIGGGA